MKHQKQTTEYREAVAAVAADIEALAAMLEAPLAVTAQHAALVWTVEQCGGAVDLFTGEIEWQNAGWTPYSELTEQQQEAARRQFQLGDLAGFGYWLNGDGSILCRRAERQIRNWGAVTPWEK